MKKFLKILEISAWVLFAAGLFTLLGFTTAEHNRLRCTRYSINIDYGSADVLVTKEDVYGIIKRTGNLLKGEKYGSVDAERIEKVLRKQPYIAKADVYVTLDGEAIIDVVQRQPVLRIFNKSNESFYLDGTGHLLPLNPNFSARVIVASGYIPETYVHNINYTADTVKLNDSLQFNSVMNNLYRLSLYIQKDKFLKALIDQIYVDPAGEFELIPRIGNQVILFGNAEDMDDKFEKLMVFYRKGLSKTGWNKYKIINIKYKNQVVATKSENQ
jgi:cell division protein FtsQ